MIPYILAAVGGYLIGDSLKAKLFAGGGNVDFRKFKEGTLVKTNMFISAEDYGGEENIDAGTKGEVYSEPDDEEELVGVIIDDVLYYLPQSSLDIMADSQEFDDEETAKKGRNYSADDEAQDFEVFGKGKI